MPALRADCALSISSPSLFHSTILLPSIPSFFLHSLVPFRRTMLFRSCETRTEAPFLLDIFKITMGVFIGSDGSFTLISCC